MVWCKLSPDEPAKVIIIFVWEEEGRLLERRQPQLELGCGTGKISHASLLRFRHWLAAALRHGWESLEKHENCCECVEKIKRGELQLRKNSKQMDLRHLEFIPLSVSIYAERLCVNNRWEESVFSKVVVESRFMIMITKHDGKITTNILFDLPLPRCFHF